MSHSHLVRLGVMGHIGHFVSADAVRYPRGTRVICRTLRGLEVGHVLAGRADRRAGEPDGRLLRGVTVEDDLLIERLERNRHRALTACQTLLDEHQLPAVLMDVEHLFDGSSLYFYFLGDVPDEIESITGALADTYDTEVQFRRFSDSLTEGCGPACGTEEAAGNGCGTGGCVSCAVQDACKPRG